jgi:sRNA-binding carbon storage regulator CsrA
MLYLRRKIGKAVVIGFPDGRELKLTVDSITSKEVKLAFSDFTGMTVRREELHENIKAGVPAPAFPNKLRLNRDSIPVGAI